MGGVSHGSDCMILLMFIAYRGFSVILFAPIIVMLAVLVTDPAMVAPMFSSVFMEKMVVFLKLYFPFFLLSYRQSAWVFSDCRCVKKHSQPTR